MKITLVAVLLFFVSSAMAAPPSFVVPVTVENEATNPVPVEVQNLAEQRAVEYRVVGVTETFFPGDADGYAVLHRACSAEVASNARACFSAEVRRGIPDMGSFVAEAWVIPSEIKLIVTPSGEWLAYDPGSGQTTGSFADFSTAIAALDCNQYRSSSATFGSVSVRLIDGTMSSQVCNVVGGSPVACCAPVAVPTAPLSETQ